MLGRHVYRVHLDEEQWVITKEGEDKTRGIFGDREAAMAGAYSLAAADEPSRVVVDNGDGVILYERLFGSDLSQELDAVKG